MKKIKNLSLLICGIFLFGFSFAQVSVNPIYTSERFQPSDKFHAGCENQIDVTFHLDNSKINGLNSILEYDGNKIEIIKIIPQGEKENNLTYTVENDKIIFSKLKTDDDGLDSVTFTIYFKVFNPMQTQFSFLKGSYIVDSKGNMVELAGNYDFEFIEVPECEPDIVAPNVELIFPSDATGDYVALDSYFKFKISDAGKGINNGSIKISIDGIYFDLGNIEYERNDDELTIYPDFWMPLDTGFLVEISVSDKQVYGGANMTTKTYEFHTSNDLNLLNEIDPVNFRKIVNMDKYIKGSENECDLLSDYFLDSSSENRDILQSINKKLNCAEFIDIENDSEIADDLELIDQNKDFSAFAMIGWILFGSLALFGIFSRLKK